MGWIIFAAIMFYFLRSYDQETYKTDSAKGITIGKTIKKDGYYFTNIGDLEDNDHWVMVGKYTPIYYINVFECENNILLKIDDEESENAVDVCECEAEDGVIIAIDFLKSSYTSFGNK